MWSLPNLLTLSRIAALPLLVVLLWWPAWSTGYALAFLLYAAMAATDWLDGKLARARATVSKLGTFLDPIADKAMVAAVLLMLSARGIIADVHLVAALAILLREILVSGLREFLGGLMVTMPVSRLAKWKTAAQLVALGALILAGALPDVAWLLAAGLAALWAAAVLTLVTGWAYLRIGFGYMDS